MASPLPSRWSTSCSSYKPSFRSSSSSSVFFQFHIIPTKRHRITTVSLLDSSSSTSSNPKRRLRRSLNSEIPNPKLLTTDCNAENEVSVQTVGSQNRGTLSFQTLFGRQSLWGRILFASKRVRSVILLNVITIVYASNIPVLKEVEASMDPAAFTVVRFTVSAIPFIPFVLRARGDVEIRNAGIELGFWVSLGYLMQTLGLLSSEAGRASFISMFTVIVVPLLDGMLGAIVPARTWFGVLMSILGVAMLECSGSPPNVGDLLNFLSAVFFGVHMLRTEHISRRTTKENFLPLLGYEVCVVAFFSTMWYFVGGWSANIQQYDTSSWTLAMFWDLMVAFPWIPMLYTGIFSTGLCLWIELAAMRDVSATEAAIIYGLEPVWGAGFAWFLLGERWGTTGWIGAALVLGGSLTVQIFGSSPSNSREEEETSKKGEFSGKQNGFSTSPLAVSSRKDVDDLRLNERRRL